MKLTMLLQDSFEDHKSKILMILCADPKEMNKTLCTLEYGAKAKCIVRGSHTPNKRNNRDDESSAVILGTRISAMDELEEDDSILKKKLWKLC
ncbi:hypothetical protein N665_0010s0027 [Sinapis alba]|nr:hypothetical protein N665_0010s0027 [Sinapis alba]